MQEVIVEMPSVEIKCPHCDHESTHSSDIWNNCEGPVIAYGKTDCDKCSKWFDVYLSA